MTDRAVTSRITAVSVFRSGALITRAAELRWGSGEVLNVVRIEDLPLCIDDASVAARLVDPPPGIMISGVRVGLGLPQIDGEPSPPHDEELKSAQRKVTQVQDRIQQTQETIGRFEQLQVPDRPKGAEGEKPPAAPTAARLALLEYQAAELERLGEENRSLKVELREAKEQLRLVEDEWRRSSTDRQARVEELRKTVHITVNHTQTEVGAFCRLVLDYVVPGARWAPGYTLRFDPDFGGAKLEMRAVVCQQSGEDWEEVALTLATADKQRWSELPELSAVRIGRAQSPELRSGWRPPPPDAGLLFSDYDRARSAIGVPAGIAEEALEDLESRIVMAGAAPAAEEVLADSLSEDLMMSVEEAEAVEEMTMAAPMAAAAPKMARRRGGKIPSPPFSAKPPEPELATELRADARFLDYGNLQMPGPDDSGRGRLSPRSLEQIYQELLVYVNVDIRFDVVVMLQQATQRAAGVADLDLPGGFTDPVAWQDFDFAYRSAAPVSVVSDGQFHAVPLIDQRADSELRFIAVPRESSEVYRSALLVNPLSAPLPAGPMDVFCGSDFLLSSSLNAVAPNGKTEVGLGVEEAVKVARNTSFSEESSGLLGGKLKLEHAIVVEVINHLGQGIVVDVRERVPIARKGDEKVEVEVSEVEPPWEHFAQKRSAVEGGYVWNIELSPGESKKLSAVYSVIIAAKHELVGGNRRES